MPNMDTVFKAYDIRGTVPDQLDAQIVEAIGAAFAAFARSDPQAAAPPTEILIGHDMRPTGPEFAQAFACKPGAKMIRKDRCEVW